jgi:hypothetical protein
MELAVSTFSISGLPALAWGLGFAVLGSAPVWAAAKVVGAQDATLFRSGLSLVIGTIATIVALSILGTWALLLAPIAYVLAFMFFLGTGLLSSIVLAILAFAGYVAMAKVIGGGMSFS